MKVYKVNSLAGIQEPDAEGRPFTYIGNQFVVSDVDWIKQPNVTEVTDDPALVSEAAQLAQDTPSLGQEDFATKALFWLCPDVYEQQVKDEGARRLKLLVSGYSDEERETWGEQVAEAEKVKAGGTSLMLEPMAGERGLTVEQFADAILANRALKAALSGQILAAQKRLLTADPKPIDVTADEHWP